MLSDRWQPVLISGQKIKRVKERGFDCKECPKVPADTREELIQLGLKIGPEQAINVEPAKKLLLRYHEVQAGAPFPECSFQSRLFGMIHYMLFHDQLDAVRQTSQTPAMMMAFLKAI